MCTGPVLLILSCIQEVNFYRTQNVFLYDICKSVSVSRMENSMLEGRDSKPLQEPTAGSSTAKIINETWLKSL
jgi:hypothetical protein